MSRIRGKGVAPEFGVRRMLQGMFSRSEDRLAFNNGYFLLLAPQGCQTSGMSTAPQKSVNRIRQSLRLELPVWSRIDRSRLQRAGTVSRNTWITEAILEKLDRENSELPFVRLGVDNDV
jgi:hypothetical protein